MFKRNLSRLIKLFFVFAAASSLASCLYRMPSDTDMRTVPTTNNPTVIRDSSTPLMPSIGY